MARPPVQQPPIGNRLRTAAVALAALLLALGAFRLGAADPEVLGIRTHALVRACMPLLVGLLLLYGARGCWNAGCVWTPFGSVSRQARPRWFAVLLAVTALLALLAVSLSLARFIAVLWDAVPGI
jgi:hypothetical protein